MNLAYCKLRKFLQGGGFGLRFYFNNLLKKRKAAPFETASFKTHINPYAI